MDSLYFICMLAGVLWLAVWSTLPKPLSGAGWWPFEMRGDAGPAAPPGDGAPQREPPASRWSASGRAAPAWRRR